MIMPATGTDSTNSKRRRSPLTTSSIDNGSDHESKRIKFSASKSVAGSHSRRNLHNSRDRISRLSDELLIRVLQQLPLETILLVQSISHRFAILATDSQVWKRLYYTRFVLPRALRLRRGGGAAGVEDGEDVSQGRWHFASRRSRWLDEEKLLEWETGSLEGGDAEVVGVVRLPRTDWKARYRLRHNWSRGKAEVRRVGMGDVSKEDVDNENEEPVVDGGRLMARLVNGVVISVDGTEGLRAWDVKNKDRKGEEVLAISSVPAVPTSLGIDSSKSDNGTAVALGFADGGFGIWRLQSTASGMVFKQQFVRSGAKGANRRLTAVAYAESYLLTISSSQILSLYSFKQDLAPTSETLPLPQPTLLASLTSHTTWPPLTLSLRPSPASLIASIAYSLPTYTSGWSVGLQELHLDTITGVILQSRLTSATETGFHYLLSTPPSPSPSTPTSTTLAERSRTDGRGHLQATNAKPTSLSYSHPYLLAGHADNTLTLYLVSSSPTDLKIGKGVKLWGHTSEVQGAMIGERGRAISVGGGPGGGEVRVWELEGGISKGWWRRGERSVRVVGERDEEDDAHESRTTDKRWVGFDEEVVVVMREGQAGPAVEVDGHTRGSALMVYDFT